MSRADNIFRSLGLRHLLPTIDSRPPDQVERDLEDEFAFHIEQRGRDLVAEGVSCQEASRIATQRFGNVNAIKRQCKRIALQERIMLQRVNFVMMIVVMLMVIAVGVQVLITQRYNTLALNAITADLSRMKFDDLAAQRGAASPGTVYLDGDVARPGVYNLPVHERLTLRRLIASSGGAKAGKIGLVRVTSLDSQGGSIIRFENKSFDDAWDSDVVLEPNDHVHVQRARWSDPGYDKISEAGRWQQVNADGTLAESGWTLEFIGEDDLRYRSVEGDNSKPIALLSKPDGTERYLVFYQSRQLVIAIRDKRDAAGRWTIEGEQLLLSVVDVFPEISEPLRFVPVSTDAKTSDT